MYVKEHNLYIIVRLVIIWRDFSKYVILEGLLKVHKYTVLLRRKLMDSHECLRSNSNIQGPTLV